MMLQIKFCKARKFIFHGAQKRRRILNPRIIKNKIMSSKVRGKFVFATPRFDIAIIHALLPREQCKWARLPDKRIAVQVPMGGFKVPKKSGYIHAFPRKGFMGNSTQSVSRHSVIPRVVIKVPIHALSILMRTKTVAFHTSEEVLKDMKRRYEENKAREQ
jgi:hypothetical protein